MIPASNKTKNADKELAKQRKNDAKRKPVGTRLHDWFIVIFGIAFLLSFSLNVIQLTGGSGYDEGDGSEGQVSGKDSTRTALHRAMKDFRGSSKQLLKKRIQRTTEREEPGQLMKLGSLDCKAYGGLSPNIANDMVYWQDISSDSSYVSPFFKVNSQEGGGKKYLTFEPDGGGWNNIRMSMESTIMMAIAMGRTLVMPPQKKMYLLGKNHGGQRHHFSFVDFFPIAEMAEDNEAFNVISMKEYLEEEAMKGNLVNRVSQIKMAKYHIAFVL